MCSAHSECKLKMKMTSKIVKINESSTFPCMLVFALSCSWPQTAKIWQLISLGGIFYLNFDRPWFCKQTEAFHGGSKKFCQKGSNFDNVIFVNERREDPNTTICGVSLACRWWPNIECWLGSLVLFQGIRPSIAIKLYFCDFSGVGGGGPDPPVSFWIRPCVHTPPNSDLGHCFHVLLTCTWLSLMCQVHFLASRPPRATPNLKTTRGRNIEVSGLFDLKKDHAVFAFDFSWYN